MIIILFGLSGSGKNYVGELLAKHFGFTHIDADQWLTDEMKQSIENKQSFSLPMLEVFTKKMIENIEQLKHIHPKLVISQGLYRNKNREAIKQHFLNNETIFIQVNANKATILKRLKARGDWISSDYASTIEQFFEPMPNAHIINNDTTGDESIIAQFKEILLQN